MRPLSTVGVWDMLAVPQNQYWSTHSCLSHNRYGEKKGEGEGTESRGGREEQRKGRAEEERRQEGKEGENNLHYVLSSLVV